jgi:hypothetical protein
MEKGEEMITKHSDDLYMIHDKNDELYLSVRNAELVQIQLHQVHSGIRGLFLDLDKEAIPDLIHALQEVCGTA